MEYIRNIWPNVLKMWELQDGIKKHKRAGNGKLCFENLRSHFVLQLLGMCFILLHFCALLSRDGFEVNLDWFPGLTAPAALISSYDKWLFQSALIILTPNYSHSPISLVLSSNVLPLLPFKAMCFEAYNPSIGLITSSELIIFKGWWLC